jgi:DNA-binding NarL/FixJ family response regulator
MERLRLLIVADDPLARAGLAALLLDTADCTIVGQISGLMLTADFPPDFSERPDVIIWDLGWEPAEQLPDWEWPVPVVALLGDDEGVTAVYQSGVQAILPRDMDTDKLIAAAQAVTHGLTVIDPQFTSSLIPRTESDDFAPLEELTARELEVLQRLSEGLTNKAIAQILGISEHTVKFHVNAIMSKLQAQSRTEAVVRATRLGLILL